MVAVIMEEISKKDLLILTGISYGQLYRWKRKGLIPEAWFNKRASFTGQETYFPKDLVIERIDKILELKDDRSLEELSKIINSSEIRKYSLEELKLTNIFINNDIFSLTKADEIAFTEVVILKIIDNIYQEIESEKCMLEFYQYLTSKTITDYQEIYINTNGNSIKCILTKANSITYNFHDFQKIDLKQLINNLKLIIMV